MKPKNIGNYVELMFTKLANKLRDFGNNDKPIINDKKWYKCIKDWEHRENMWHAGETYYSPKKFHLIADNGQVYPFTIDQYRMIKEHFVEVNADFISHDYLIGDHVTYFIDYTKQYGEIIRYRNGGKSALIMLQNGSTIEVSLDSPNLKHWKIWDCDDGDILANNKGNICIFKSLSAMNKSKIKCKIYVTGVWGDKAKYDVLVDYSTFYPASNNEINMLYDILQDETETINNDTIWTN